MAPDASGFRCSVEARARCDVLHGTAAPAAGWVLVENSGIWPRRAFEETPLGGRVGRAIVQRARAEHVRPLFVRRHGPRRPAAGQAFGVVDSRTEAVTWSSYVHLDEVLRHDWVATSPCPGPMYLVCTHGRHDRCCAIAGRPVAAALAQSRPEQTWECTHLGGDRFAGNVLVLPYGLYYGFVEPGDVADIVAATERGEVFLPRLRGRSCDPPPVQAARIAAQRELGLVGIHDLELVSNRLTRRRWVVSFRAGGDTVVAAVEQRRAGEARATCAHKQAVPLRELQVVDLMTRPAH